MIVLAFRKDVAHAILWREDFNAEMHRLNRVRILNVITMAYDHVRDSVLSLLYSYRNFDRGFKIAKTLAEKAAQMALHTRVFPVCERLLVQDTVDIVAVGLVVCPEVFVY